MEKVNRSDVVREQIRKHLFDLGEGVKIREAKLFEAISQTTQMATPGVLNGISNNLKSGAVPIPNVEVEREGGKCFYYYRSYRFPESTVMGKVQQAAIDFKNALQKDGLLSISHTVRFEMPAEERRAHGEFLEKFTDLMSLFYAETHK